MSAQRATFAFDENASLDDNLTAFGNYIDQLDALLGAEMRGNFQKLVEGNHKTDEIWERLFAICTAPPAAADGVATEGQDTVASANPPAIAQPPAAAMPTVTGWLLEGVLIEGFRGGEQ